MIAGTRGALTLVSAAAAFLCALPGSHAFAEGPLWDVQLQGGFLRHKQFTPPTAAERVDIFAAPARALGPDSIEQHDNGTGRFSVRRRVDALFDIGFAYTGIGGAENRRTLTSDLPVILIFPGLISSPITAAVGGLTLDARTESQQHVVDLDVGRDFALGPFGALKVTGGARLAYYRQTTNLALAPAFFPVQAEFSHQRKDEFIGAGPRLGAQWSYELGAGFSVNVATAGALLFGQQKFRTSLTGFSGLATGAFNDSHGRTVYNGEGEVSLGYSFLGGFYAAVGYQASAWFGLRDNRRELDAAATLAASGVGATLLSGGRRFPIDIYHGPFLRLGFKW